MFVVGSVIIIIIMTSLKYRWHLLLKKIWKKIGGRRKKKKIEKKRGARKNEGNDKYIYIYVTGK